MVDEEKLVREALDFTLETYKYYDDIVRSGFTTKVCRVSEEGMCALVLVCFAPEGEIALPVIVDFEQGIQELVPSYMSLDSGFDEFVSRRMSVVGHRLRLKRWRSST